MHQTHPLFPHLFLLQFHPQQSGPLPYESMRLADDPQTLSAARGLEMGNHRERDRGRDHFQNHQDSEPAHTGIGGPGRHADRRSAEAHRLGDLQDRKLILQEPKSDKEHELVFIPQKVGDRLREYALEVCKSPDDRIFPISY